MDVSLASRCAKAAVACSARSGVAPSMTTAIIATRCGKFLAKSISRCRHERSGEISFAVSVSIAMCRTAYTHAIALNTAAATSVRHGCVAHAATTRVISARKCRIPFDSSGRRPRCAPGSCLKAISAHQSVVRLFGGCCGQPRASLLVGTAARLSIPSTPILPTDLSAVRQRGMIVQMAHARTNLCERNR